MLTKLETVDKFKIMEEIKHALKNLDLSRQEIDIYLACLELGKTTVLQIARKVDIPRSTIYLIVDLLINKGLLLQTAERKKKIVMAAAPEKILQLAEEKKYSLIQAVDILEKNLSQLQATFNRKVGKPKIRYYEGKEGVKTIYEDTLSAGEILVHCMSQRAIPLMGEYLKKYFVRVIRRMIRTKEIISDTKEDRQYQKEYSTSNNEIICLSKKYITNTDYMVYEDKIAFITYKGNQPIGIVIEDSELAHFERIRFLLLWQAIKAGIF